MSTGNPNELPDIVTIDPTSLIILRAIYENTVKRNQDVANGCYDLAKNVSYKRSCVEEQVEHLVEDVAEQIEQTITELWKQTEEYTHVANETAFIWPEYIMQQFVMKGQRGELNLIVMKEALQNVKAEMQKERKDDIQKKEEYDMQQKRAKTLVKDPEAKKRRMIAAIQKKVQESMRNDRSALNVPPQLQIFQETHVLSELQRLKDTSGKSDVENASIIILQSLQMSRTQRQGYQYDDDGVLSDMLLEVTFQESAILEELKNDQELYDLQEELELISTEFLWMWPDYILGEKPKAITERYDFKLERMEEVMQKVNEIQQHFDKDVAYDYPGLKKYLDSAKTPDSGDGDKKEKKDNKDKKDKKDKQVQELIKKKLRGQFDQKFPGGTDANFDEFCEYRDDIDKEKDVAQNKYNKELHKTDKNRKWNLEKGNEYIAEENIRSRLYHEDKNNGAQSRTFPQVTWNNTKSEYEINQMILAEQYKQIVDLKSRWENYEKKYQKKTEGEKSRLLIDQADAILSDTNDPRYKAYQDSKENAKRQSREDRAAEIAQKEAQNAEDKKQKAAQKAAERAVRHAKKKEEKEAEKAQKKAATQERQNQKLKKLEEQDSSEIESTINEQANLARLLTGLDKMTAVNQAKFDVEQRNNRGKNHFVEEGENGEQFMSFLSNSSFQNADGDWSSLDFPEQLGVLEQLGVREHKRNTTGDTTGDTVSQRLLSTDQHNFLFFEWDYIPDDIEQTSSKDMDYNIVVSQRDDDTVMGGTGASFSGAKKLQSKITQSSFKQTNLILFNTEYARILLKHHLEDLHEMWGKNEDAVYVDVPGALGSLKNKKGGLSDEKLADAVDKLLPTFENMLRYRNTILKVKEIELQNELELIASTQPHRYKRLQVQLDDIKAHEIKSVWGDIQAKRMLQSERGQLPGQLYTPQPTHLPLRIWGPPRVGKSATALLVASLAKRIGMTSFYSVSPNKNGPKMEITKKLERIRWGVPKRRTDADQNEVLMKYEAVEVKQFFEEPTKYYQRDHVPDMVLYSSDVLLDVQQVGALLAKWRRSNTVVFHIRDEAQSLAKEEKNSFVTPHKEYVPPPPILQYLRYYFGNMYGLNCLVTATLFPTFLEENLYGFFGSTSQNVKAGLPISASHANISGHLGSKYLPEIVPALKPHISEGYIGVDHIEEWKYTEALKEVKRCGKDDSPKRLLAAEKNKGDVAYLQYGANHSGVRYGSDKRMVDTVEDAACRANQREDNKKKGKEKADNEDSRAIDQHFLDWLLHAKEKTIDELRSVSQQDQGSQDTMMPTYIGALNHDVKDDKMASFVRHFGFLSHRHIQTSKDTNATNGVAFCLFASVFKNKCDIERSGIRIMNDPGSKSDTMPMVCFVYNPNNPEVDACEEPAFKAFFASSAEEAIAKVWNEHNITKVAILGYGMLKAGLTVQTVVEVPAAEAESKTLEIQNGDKTQQVEKKIKRIYCPQYLALAVAEDASLDAQLQMAGRAFVELKNTTAPDKWRIQLLGVENMLDRLLKYSNMERILANINKLPLFKALKVSFSSSLMNTNQNHTLGVVGVRGGDFGSILGLTVQDAMIRAAAAESARKTYEKKRGGSEPLTKEDLKYRDDEAEEIAERIAKQFQEQEQEEDSKELPQTVQVDAEAEKIAQKIAIQMREEIQEQEELQQEDIEELEKRVEELEQQSRPKTGKNPRDEPPCEEPPCDHDTSTKKKAKTIDHMATGLAAALREAPELRCLLQTSTGRQLRVLHHLLEKW